MTIDMDARIGRIAAEHPLATRVFARHGIDFCCGGGRPVGAVCREKGLDPDDVLGELRAVIEAGGDDIRSFDDAPLDELIDHIVETYHRPLDEELPRLDAMAGKVLEVHGDKDPERLGELVTVFRGLRAELEAHMEKEEEVLFPMIRSGDGAATGAPYGELADEHETAGAALARLRELTRDYRVPEGACNTWRALWHGLLDLERSLMEHIHLENNVLFPRAGA